MWSLKITSRWNCFPVLSYLRENFPLQRAKSTSACFVNILVVLRCLHYCGFCFFAFRHILFSLYLRVLYGWIREQARWSKLCVLICYPSGHDRPILPPLGFPARAPQEKVLALQHCSNITTLCSVKNRRCKSSHLRWSYTGRFATTIFSATQRCNVGAML